jgi:hypothetical protein
MGLDRLDADIAQGVSPDPQPIEALYGEEEPW